MYAYISGTLTEINKESVVIDNNGIGYEIFVSGLLISHLPVVGSDIKLYTYLHITENVQTIFGFLSKAEKEMFLMLLSVNSVGPKSALSVLSILEVDDLKFAILSEDKNTIKKANGIGDKAAQRIIIDLKDKISIEDAFEEKISKADNEADSAASMAKSDAVMALNALGYSNTDILKAISKIENINEMETQQIIKAALSMMH